MAGYGEVQIIKRKLTIVRKVTCLPFMKMCRETLTVGQKRGCCREVTHMDRWLLVEF